MKNAIVLLQLSMSICSLIWCDAIHKIVKNYLMVEKKCLKDILWIKKK